MRTYIFDISAAATQDLLLDQIKNFIKSLELKDLGPVENFVGIRIAFDGATGYTLDQEKPIMELLEKTKLERQMMCERR